MLTRSLIVVLGVLNIGVASWWMLRADPEPPATVQPVQGVARLQLLDPPRQAAADSAGPTPASGAVAAAEAPARSTPASAAPGPAPAPQAPAPTPPAPDQPLVARCITLGPFATRDIALTAQARARPAMTRSALREVADASATRYRVILPPAASREQAQETVKRIVAAGLSDYYVINTGDEANAIALGQYRNREGAERRIAAVQAAGFQPRLVASGGDGSSQWWLDATLAAQASPETIREQARATQSRSLDCARLR